MPDQPFLPSEFTVRVYSPDFQHSEVLEFLQGMFNRTGFSFHKYGSIHDNFPHNRTGVDNAVLRIQRYAETGNKEELIDAANYLLIEFLRPSHPDAHFRATDSDESPGALNRDGSISHGKDDTTYYAGKEQGLSDPWAD